MWDELIENKQGEKLGPMVWACDCRNPVYPRREQVFTQMFHTSVDTEGICITCGNYATRLEDRFLNLSKKRKKHRRSV